MWGRELLMFRALIPGHAIKLGFLRPTLTHMRKHIRGDLLALIQHLWEF